mgnify:CR=1 FL=1
MNTDTPANNTPAIDEEGILIFAKALDKKVHVELPPLKMERAQFITDITTAPDGATGRDQVRFLVSTNPGTPIGPLEKIASGGELARFSLAIKVALAGAVSGAGQKVMIFDEVDQGVGGAVADAVGRRLSKLAQSAQVLVVTHSPQLADILEVEGAATRVTLDKRDGETVLSSDRAATAWA